MRQKLYVILALIFNLLPTLASGQESDSIIGRPYKDFETTAFCVYESFLPSQNLTDNNRDILCTFVNPITTDKLDSIDI